MSIGQLSKRGYYKYSKLFEIVLGLACIGFSAYCLTTHYINKDMYLNFLIYEGIVGLIIFASILVYFNSKKISIYE